VTIRKGWGRAITIAMREDGKYHIHADAGDWTEGAEMLRKLHGVDKIIARIIARRLDGK